MNRWSPHERQAESMTPSLAFRGLLSPFLPGLFALPGVIALISLLRWLSSPDSCISLTCCPGFCLNDALLWAKDNAALASLGALTIPLVLAILLDDWRHCFWPCREDTARWENGATKKLARMPSHLFRFMYDEYYYYIEFDGNSFLAVGFSGLFVFLNYARTSLPGWGGIIILIVSSLLGTFLWRSWNRGLENFFEDLNETSAAQTAVG
jgi:hypothetical protein